jgi:hypothetical protein
MASAVLVGPVNWYKTANLPGYRRIYTRSQATGTFDGKSIYLVATVINKNKSPERHELIILCATPDNKIVLVERLLKGIDKQYVDGSLGQCSLIVLADQKLHFTVTLDNDPEASAMFPPNAFLADGNARQDIHTYKV